MDLYHDVSYELSELLTRRYSTSFSMSSRLFAADIRPHIYAIYGLARIADEIVDAYRGSDALAVLDELEAEVTKALSRGYSANPIVHSFVVTANRYGITAELITPFFTSMRLDTTEQVYDRALYERYVYGSAEVIGLMCLKVFVGGNAKMYRKLAPGAKALGSAYQKVNFLRDLKADTNELGRSYFPGVTPKNFDTRKKTAIIDEIRSEFLTAHTAVVSLPRSARRAIELSYRYYSELLTRLERATPEMILTRRIRVPGWRKLWLFITTIIRSVL